MAFCNMPPEVPSRVTNGVYVKELEQIRREIGELRRVQAGLPDGPGGQEAFEDLEGDIQNLEEELRQVEALRWG